MFTFKPADSVTVTSTSFVTVGSPSIPVSDWKAFTCFVSANMIRAGHLDVAVQHAPEVDPASPGSALWADLKTFTQFTTSGVKTVVAPDSAMGNYIRIVAKVNTGEYVVTAYFVPKG